VDFATISGAPTYYSQTPQPGGTHHLP